MAEADSTDPRTVFIKGISFDWDNSDFEKAVSDVGPVRKCFLLKGAGKHHKVRSLNAELPDCCLVPFLVDMFTPSNM